MVIQLLVGPIGKNKIEYSDILFIFLCGPKEIYLDIVVIIVLHNIQFSINIYLSEIKSILLNNIVGGLHILQIISKYICRGN